MKFTGIVPTSGDRVATLRQTMLCRTACPSACAWYNGTRLHSTLGYRSPAEFEKAAKIKKVAECTRAA